MVVFLMEKSQSINLVGGLENDFFLTFHILGIVTPTDFHIFKRGRYTTNQ